MKQEEVGFSGGLMTFHVGSSLCKRGHQPWFDTPPPKSLLPTYPWSSSFPSRHPHSLVLGCQASSSLHLFFCCSTIFCLHASHHWLGFCLLQGGPQSVPYKSYIHIHMLGRGLSWWGLIAANGGEDIVDQEPRPTSEHQIVWTVPGNCRSGGIIGMHYFSQMRWPVGFSVFSQLPNHAHNHLVQYLYQSITLGVVGHGLHLFDAKDLAQFLNYTTGEAGTSIT